MFVIESPTCIQNHYFSSRSEIEKKKGKMQKHASAALRLTAPLASEATVRSLEVQWPSPPACVSPPTRRRSTTARAGRLASPCAAYPHRIWERLGLQERERGVRRWV